jgi:hypothetical protein
MIMHYDRLINLLRIGSFGLLLAAVLHSPLTAQNSEFGTADGTEAALIGILYDLKQNQQGEPSEVTEDNYKQLIGEFLSSEWDEAVLNQYFRVSRPVYATRIFMPMMSAGQAPKAFGIDDVVAPRLWLVHYKGQVVAPMDGVYRVAGFADDFMAVRMNAQTVLVSGRFDCIPTNFEWKSSAADGLPVGNGRMRYGDWVSVKAGEVVDLDVIVGERPGGEFGAWLYIERKGETYPQYRALPVLPVFQLSDTPISTSNGRFSGARKSSVWKALQ